jgi:hypothetical protein
VENTLDQILEWGWTVEFSPLDRGVLALCREGLYPSYRHSIAARGANFATALFEAWAKIVVYRRDSEATSAVAAESEAEIVRQERNYRAWLEGTGTVGVVLQDSTDGGQTWRDRPPLL